jgi:tetratricopeptide (TPR) repeat protein
MPKYIFLLVLVLGFTATSAQRLFNQPMQIKDCKIEIQCKGMLTETIVELEFFNNRAAEAEGLFSFTLNPGQAVTGFQLELNGHFRDGSIEERWKASQAYNTIVGKRIDPALLQMTGYDSYSLNIYPFPPFSSRKVRVRIEEVIQFTTNRYHYVLPLLNNQVPENLSIQIQQMLPGAKGVDTRGLLKGLSFTGQAGNEQLRSQFNKPFMTDAIRFSLEHGLADDNNCIYDESGRFFAKLPPRRVSKVDITMERLRVYWNCGYSMGSAEHKKFIRLLKDILKAYPVKQLTIVPFNHKPMKETVFTGEALAKNHWKQYVEVLPQYGATQISTLDFNTNDDYILVFVNKGNTWGSAVPDLLRVPALVVTTGNTYMPYWNVGYRSYWPNHNLYEQRYTPVKQLAQLMYNSSPESQMTQIVAHMRQQEVGLIGVDNDRGEAATLEEAGYAYETQSPTFITGKTARNSRSLLVRYGYGNKTIFTDTLSFATRCDVLQFEKARALGIFAAIKQNSYYWYNTLALGIDHKIVTLQTAFIVLERVEDYVRYNITPPNELLEECTQKGYVKRDYREQYHIRQKNDEITRLQAVATAYNGRLKWSGLQENTIQSETLLKSFHQAETIKEKKEMGKSENALFGFKHDLREEVVTLGYASKRRGIAYGVLSLSANDIGHYKDIAGILQGRVSGISITTDGQPGSISSISLRGYASITGNSNPAIVVDGFVVDAAYLNTLTPADVQYLDVLRPGPATAQYGSVAANGAIIIITRKGSPLHLDHTASVRLKTLEDVDYIDEIKNTPAEEKVNRYRELEKSNSDNASFYMDMALHFHESGLTQYVDDMMYKVAEMQTNSISAQLNIAYVYEYLGQFKKAAALYQGLWKDNPQNPGYARNLGWTLYQQGLYDSAVHVLYAGLLTEEYYTQSESAQMKEIILTDMNMMIGLHGAVLQLDDIPSALIRPMSSPMRVTLESAEANLNLLFVREPGGHIVDKESDATNSKRGRLQLSQNQGYIADYQLNLAARGNYRISMRYYDYGQNRQAAKMVKIMRIRNFGKPDQHIGIDLVSLDNQFGEVEIDDFKIRW